MKAKLSRWFDYQSVCHCSKTADRRARDGVRLTTSQFVTAPKLTFQDLERAQV